LFTILILSLIKQQKNSKLFIESIYFAIIKLELC
jgi:hypothetical protein